MTLSELYTAKLLEKLTQGYKVQPSCKSEVPENHQYIYLKAEGDARTWVLWSNTYSYHSEHTDMVHFGILHEDDNSWEITETYEVEA